MADNKLPDEYCVCIEISVVRILLARECISGVARRGHGPPEILIG